MRRARCIGDALDRALAAYLATHTDPITHMRAHARPTSDDGARTCERAVLTAAGLLESQIVLASDHGTQHNGGGI